MVYKTLHLWVKFFSLWQGINYHILYPTNLFEREKKDVRKIIKNKRKRIQKVTLTSPNTK